MKNREPIFVEEIIKRFHSRRFPRKVANNFHLWLLSSRDYTAKDQAMSEVWLDTPYSVTRSAYRSLDTVKVRLGMTEPKRGSIRLNRVAMRVAAVLLPAMLMVGAYFIVSGGAGNVEWASVEVPYGETGYYMLADGTEVWLNSGSHMEYPVEFKGRKRDVKLYGEGFFDVAGNKRKPFTVHTEHMSTKVVGTQFNVSCYGNQKHESVTVLGGQVDVTTPDNETHSLVPDRHLTHSIADGQTQIEEVDAASMIRWRENGLVFDNSTFEDILCALQRKFNFRIVIDSANFNGSLYRMQFVNGEPLDYILDVVHSVAGLPYTFEAGTLTVGSDLKNAQELAMKKRLLQRGGK